MAVCIVASPFIAIHGIPAFRHDWQWPYDSAVSWQWLTDRLDAWDYRGIGRPNVVVSINPYWFLVAASVAAMGARAGLYSVLAIIAITAFLGMWRYLTEAVQIDGRAASFSAVLYVIGPVLFNKLVAGHVAFAFSYAVVPWALLSMTSQRRQFGGSIVTLALATAQLQAGVYTVLAALVLSPSRWRRASIACVGALFLIAPTLWSISRPAAFPIELGYKTSLIWETFQSARFVEALGASGYGPRYWFHGLPLVLYGIATVGVPIVVAAAIVLERQRSLRYVALYLAGVVIVAGLRGPLNALLALLFVHVPAMSAFRELYDAAFLIWLPAVVLAAMVLTRLPNALRTSIGSLAVILYALPWLTIPTLLGSMDASIGTQSRIAVERAPVGRFYLAPGSNPEAPIGTALAGASPLAMNVARHDVFWSYTPNAVEASVMMNENTPREFAVFARALGIAATLRRDDVTSAIHAIHDRTPQFDELPGNPIAPIGWTVSTISATASVADSGNGQPLLRLVEGRFDPDRVAAVPTVSGGATPLNGWARASDWWFVSRYAAAAVDGGLLVATDARRFPGAPGRWMVIGSGNVGAQRLAPDRWTEYYVDYRTPFHPNPGAHIVVAPKSSLQSLRTLASIGSAVDRPLGGPPLEHNTPLHQRVSRDCSRCTIVLAEGYSPEWRLLINGRDMGKPIMAGHLTAWPYTGRAGDRITLTNDAEQTVHKLELLTALFWIAAVTGTLIEASIRR